MAYTRYSISRVKMCFMSASFARGVSCCWVALTLPGWLDDLCIYFKVASPTGSSDGNWVAVGASTLTLASPVMSWSFPGGNLWSEGIPGIITGSHLCWRLCWFVSDATHCSEYQCEEIQTRSTQRAQTSADPEDLDFGLRTPGSEA